MFRMLGPLEMHRAGRWLPVRAAKPRVLLAILLLNPGRVLERDWLIDHLWNGQPPASATGILPHYVWRLRALLTGTDGASLRSSSGGYLLDVPAGGTDRDRFEELLERGRTALRRHDPAAAIDPLSRGLGLWRGPALSDVRLVPLLEAAGERLDRARCDAQELLARALLESGRLDEAVAGLEDLTAREPYRESAWHLLLLGLYRLGRRCDALAGYRRVRHCLHADLGVEPGHDLRALHQRILSEDPGLDPGTRAAVAGRPVPPAELPPDLPDFTGRAEALHLVRRAVTATGEWPPGTIVYGPGGIGKTALAVAVGHRVRARFPDGQLFVDLHGVQPDPLSPGQVLAQFLAALGVEARAIPERPADQARMYRTLLAERRVLVVLDNAAHEAQVRPLLPGAGSAVLVTSRRPLPGLEGFTRYRLAVLDAAVGLELLDRVAGSGRVAAEPDAAARIVELCGRLPLALRACGARLSAKPHWPLARLATRLADERRRLDELSAGDLAVRASLALSYAGLTELERRALLGCAALVPTSFACWLVAAVTELPEPAAEDLAERLVDAQLLDPSGTDAAGQPRYRLHDLTRLFAREQLAASWPPDRFRTVLAGWLERCVELTARAVAATGDRVRGFPPPAPMPARQPAAGRNPFGWYDAERATLLTAVGLAVRHGLPVPAWRLAHALAIFFEFRGAWDDWRYTHEAALPGAVEAGDLAGEAALRSGLGQLELDRGRNLLALAQLEPARRAAGRVARPDLLAQVLARLATCYDNLSRRDDALACSGEALELARGCGDRLTEVVVAISLGDSHRRAARLPEAIQRYREALAALHGARSRHLEPHALNRLGVAHLDTGRIAEAAGYLESAMREAGRSGDHRARIEAMRWLADARRLDGQLHAAVELLDAALATAAELDEDLGQAQALRRLGRCHAELGHHEEAGGYLDRAGDRPRGRPHRSGGRRTAHGRGHSGARRAARRRGTRTGAKHHPAPGVRLRAGRTAGRA